MTIHKILFPTDFSEVSEHAFEHAAHLADLFHAELHVLNAASGPMSDDPMGYLDLRKESAVTWSAPHTPKDGTGTRVVHAQVRVDSPSAGILEYADGHDIDLIVMATHGRRGLDRFLEGSVAEEVVRMAACAVYTIRDGDVHSQRWGRILVPLDLGGSSSETLAFAKYLATLSGARLDLLHVIEEAVFPTIYGVDSFAVAVPELVEQSRLALEELAHQTADPAVAYDCHVRIGHPANEIADFAAKYESDLIAIATHGLTGVERLLIGSVTEKVVRLAPCPVLTAKTHGAGVPVLTST